ncbi:Syntaxin F55A11.2 [Aphelenchoides avenae]|nr:Syntaxin F55A11.2 [Aphelenchus avenae]
MSELPLHFSSSASTITSVGSSTETSARRRHHHVDFSDSPSQSIDYDQREKDKYRKPQPGLSLTNFASFVAPAAQLWNSAQSSFQLAFTEQNANESYSGPTAASQVDNFVDYIPALSVEMPHRDRTQEFRTIAKSCQMKIQANGHIASNRDERNKLLQSSVQFNQLAKRIGRDLSLTCAKMEKLTELAKKKSLFDDRGAEVEQLSQVIKQDITGLNKQIAALQEVIKHRTGAIYSKQGVDHSKQVVVGLQSKLASVGKSFQDVLEIRTQNLKEKKNRREKFSQSQPVPSSLPPTASTGNMGSLLLHDDAVASGSSVALDMDRLEQQRMQDQMMLDENQSYYQDRYNAMENIESSISELGTIFRQLASLVAEQGEMITRIDSNVEETSMNVDAAHHELLKYFNNISKNRWLIIKVFGVLMAFFVFFVVFLT